MSLHMSRFQCHMALGWHAGNLAYVACVFQICYMEQKGTGAAEDT